MTPTTPSFFEVLGLTRFDGQLLYVVGTFVSILLWVAN